MLTLLISLSACNRQLPERDVTHRPRLDQPVDVIMHLTQEKGETKISTKALPDPDAVIRDLNIFLFNVKRPDIVHHAYIEIANPLQIQPIQISDIYLGKYYVYILANNGQSCCTNHSADHPELCTFRNETIKNLICAQTRPRDVIHKNGSVNRGVMMKYQGEITFTRAGENELPPLTLQRVMAKISITDILTTIPDSKLKFGTLYLSNIQVRTTPFSDVPYVEADDAYIQTHEIYTLDTETNDTHQAPYELYVLPNCGYNPNTSINSYEDKTPHKAPKKASYLIFNNTYLNPAKQTIAYYAYLGDKLTDFNIEPNTKYNYAFTFGTPDFNDKRLAFLKTTYGKFVDPITGNDSNPREVDVFYQCDLEITVQNIISKQLEVYCQNNAQDKGGEFKIERLSDDGATVIESIAESKVPNIRATILDMPDFAKHTCKIRISYKHPAPGSNITLEIQVSAGNDLNETKYFKNFTFE